MVCFETTPAPEREAVWPLGSRSPDAHRHWERASRGGRQPPEQGEGEPGGKGLGSSPTKRGQDACFKRRVCGTVRTNLWDRQAGQRKEQHSNHDATPENCEACQLQAKLPQAAKTCSFLQGLGLTRTEGLQVLLLLQGWKTGRLLDATLPRRTCAPRKARGDFPFLPRSSNLARADTPRKARVGLDGLDS